jgi:hypothetical protein
MKVLRNTLVALIAALAVLSSTRVQAQNVVARTYRFTPAAGKTAAFEQALKTHAAWRKQAGDPWDWSVYQVMTGDHTGSYMVRSGGHTWADLDAYDAGFGPKGSARFQANVAPLLASMTSWVTVSDTVHRHLPESADGYAIISLTTYHIKPGKGDQFDAAVDAYAKAGAKGGTPGRYAWFNTVNSGPGGTRGLAVFHKDWASFAPRQPSLGKATEDTFGHELADQIYRDLLGSISYTESLIMQYRPDLSVIHEGS